jgi:hypothetical protein
VIEIQFNYNVVSQGRRRSATSENAIRFSGEGRKELEMNHGREKYAVTLYLELFPNTTKLHMD